MPPQPCPPPLASSSLGDGRLSGALSLGLGVLSLFAVLCFRFPELLTTPELRAVYPDARWCARRSSRALVLALGLGALSVLLGERRRLGWGGTGLRRRRDRARRPLDRVRPGGSLAASRPRLVRAGSAGAGAGLRAARARLRAGARAAHPALRLAHGPRALLREPPAGAGAGAAHDRAGRPALRRDRLAAAPGLGRRPAAGWSSSSRRSRSRISSSTASTARSTPCPGSGASTRSITRAARWTGWRARGSTCSTWS